MRIPVRLVGFLFLLPVLVPPVAEAQEYRWVSGTVTALTDSALTIYMAGPDYNVTFRLDESSMVIAKGSFWVHPPEQTPSKLSNAIRIDDLVEVHYMRNGPRNDAGLVLTGVSDAQEAGWSLAGRVWAVSRRSLTVVADGRESTFAVAPGTPLIGPGITSRPWPGEEGSRELGGLLARNDIVLVYYLLEGTTRRVVGVRVLSSRR